MTEEVVAAIDAARAAGFDDFVVSDSHGNGQNLLIDRFANDVRIVRSWPRPLMMMQGIDDTFAAAFLLGYHAGSTSTRGVRAHTMSSGRVTRISVNGAAASEALINAAIAGHFGVPVALVTGDDATVEETQRLIGNVAGVVVKEALGFHSALTLTPAAARERIRDGARTALEQLDRARPFELEAPLELEIAFKHYRPVELLALLPAMERVEARTIRTRCRTILELSALLEFVLSYAPNLEP
jgi:D-amino peptidase